MAFSLRIFPFARTVRKNTMKIRTSNGLAALINRSLVENCGGAVVKQNLMLSAANLASIRCARKIQMMNPKLRAWIKIPLLKTSCASVVQNTVTLQLTVQTIQTLGPVFYSQV